MTRTTQMKNHPRMKVKVSDLIFIITVATVITGGLIYFFGGAWWAPAPIAGGILLAIIALIAGKVTR